MTTEKYCYACLLIKYVKLKTEKTTYEILMRASIMSNILTQDSKEH